MESWIPEGVTHAKKDEQKKTKKKQNLPKRAKLKVKNPPSNHQRVQQLHTDCDTTRFSTAS